LRQIEIEAWSQVDVELPHAQAAELASFGLVEVVAKGREDAWTLVAHSRIGVAFGIGWEVRVRPRLAVPQLFFLLGYASDPKGWKDQAAPFATDPDDLLGAIAAGFSAHSLTALERGLLRGYLRIDERMQTIRGRVRFGDQIARNATLPLPIEVTYDEYTEDVLENRMLKTATLALLRLPRVPALARKRLLKLRGLLDTISLVERPREVVMPKLTRLNERYGPALRLAELILHVASIDVARGSVSAAAFVFDMNKVFEDFVSVALREAMGSYGGIVRQQWSGWLDIQRLLGIRPDVTWWEGSRCLGVADAKYKALATKGMPNADAYQMLAYCTVLKVPRGFLVYAKDEGEDVRSHSVRNGNCVIDVRTLDVEAEPDTVLKQVEELAAEIASAGPALLSPDARGRSHGPAGDVWRPRREAAHALQQGSRDRVATT
jgi:5-methylcytosine-specific restriction enzyme subunit McrC